MPQQYENIAFTAHEWSRRSGLTDAQRSLCDVVAELADALKETANAMPEEQESLLLLGCHLCRRLDASVCCPSAASSGSRKGGVCPLGFQGATGRLAYPVAKIAA